MLAGPAARERAVIGTCISAAVLAVESVAALAIAVHTAAWLHLLLVRRRPTARPAPLPEAPSLPRMTVQLPLFNEAGQVGDLLGAVAALRWPRDRFEVQVLDDSTDETPGVVAAALPGLRAAGVDVVHLRRGDRSGFKAGALRAGLSASRGELIAIFDADFRPEPEFLLRAVAALGPDRGLVQARWAHRNARASVRTRAQALHLDAHFTLEQQARSSAGLLMGFNGTAGVWRRACIEAAGGWEADTLTEDLDLAYRAQLAGWRLGYVDTLSVDSELPDAMDAIRAQQHRWIRGGAQVARKLLRPLWRSEQPLRRKLQGTAHLLSSSVYIPVLALALALPSLPFVLRWGPEWAGVGLGAVGAVLRGVLLGLVACYLLVCATRERGVIAGAWRLVRDFPVFLALATAFAPWCARAAWMGWTAPTGEFVRTPKGEAQRRRAPRPVTLLAEAGLLVWSVVGVVAAVGLAQPLLVPFIGLQAGAFGALLWMTLRPAPRRATPAG